MTLAFVSRFEQGVTSLSIAPMYVACCVGAISRIPPASCRVLTGLLGLRGRRQALEVVALGFENGSVLVLRLAVDGLQPLLTLPPALSHSRAVTAVRFQPSKNPDRRALLVSARRTRPGPYSGPGKLMAAVTRLQLATAGMDNTTRITAIALPPRMLPTE